MSDNGTLQVKFKYEDGPDTADPKDISFFPEWIIQAIKKYKDDIIHHDIFEFLYDRLIMGIYRQSVAETAKAIPIINWIILFKDKDDRHPSIYINSTGVIKFREVKPNRDIKAGEKVLTTDIKDIHRIELADEYRDKFKYYAYFSQIENITEGERTVLQFVMISNFNKGGVSVSPIPPQIVQDKDVETLRKTADGLAKEVRKLKAEQTEWLPIFETQTNVEIKKETGRYLFDVPKMRKCFAGYENYRLENGLTIKQQLDNTEDWTTSLSFKDLSNYIKLFAYVKSVDKYYKANPDTQTEFIKSDKGIYTIKTIADGNFYKHFLKERSLGKGRIGYHSRDKEELLQWLFEKQKEGIDRIIPGDDGRFYLANLRTLQVIPEVNPSNNDKKRYVLQIDPSFLDLEFKDYLDIDLSILDDIPEALKEFKKHTKHTLYKKLNKYFRITNFEDLTIKFYLLLKDKYTRERSETINGYVCNSQRLKRETLIMSLGKLDERVKKELFKRDRISDEGSHLIDENVDRILGFLFFVAERLKWIYGKPKLSDKDTYTFYMNPSKFDIKKTAEALKALEHKK